MTTDVAGWPIDPENETLEMSQESLRLDLTSEGALPEWGDDVAVAVPDMEGPVAGEAPTLITEYDDDLDAGYVTPGSGSGIWAVDDLEGGLEEFDTEGVGPASWKSRREGKYLRVECMVGVLDEVTFYHKRTTGSGQLEDYVVYSSGQDVKGPRVPAGECVPRSEPYYKGPWTHLKVVKKIKARIRYKIYSDMPVKKDR